MLNLNKKRGKHMNIYLMRHGTTVWNEKGITQGRVNNRLSQSGKAIAEQRALELQNVEFDVIFGHSWQYSVEPSGAFSGQ